MQEHVDITGKTR